MDELLTPWAASESAPIDAASPAAADDVSPTLEFVGASDHTIAEAVRRALSNASLSLQTLEGAGVKVIPEIDPRSDRPRFRVTLYVSPHAALATARS